MAYARIIIPVPVVVEACFRIKILPWKAQIDGCSQTLWQCSTESLPLPAPQDRLALAGGKSRGVEVVGVEVGDGVGGAVVVDLGHGGVIVPEVIPDGRAVGLRFGDEVAL